jgi:predicted dienelactone hydrolase
MNTWLGWRTGNDWQKSSRRSFPFLGSLGTLVFSFGCLLPSVADAAESLTLRVGPLTQSVDVSALESLAKTGKVPRELKSYEFVFTPDVKESFRKSLHVDPFLVEPFLKDLLDSADGEALLARLSKALPGSDAHQVRQTFSLALRQSHILSFLSFVQAYPDRNLTIDLTEVAKIAVQLNASSLQNQAIAPRLERDLRVEKTVALPLNVDPSVPGKNAVSFVSLTFKDSERQRDIPVDLYYSAKTRGPLIVISHGFAADRKSLKYLARHLASHGFTVAALDHPGSNIYALIRAAMEADVSQLLPASEFIDRPLDVSFLLDELEILNRQQGRLQGKFNTQQVTVIGHSFGSYTALTLAGAQLNPKAVRNFCKAVSPLERAPSDWLQCAVAELPYSTRQFRDTRVAQVVAFNPIIGDLFGHDLSKVTIPVAIVSASEDGITPTISHQLLPFGQLKGEKYLLVALGATHMSVTDISNANSTVGQSTLVKEIMGEEAQGIRQLAKGISLAFIEQLTPQAPTYRPFLSPTYAQSFSNDRMTFRFTEELPPSLDTWLNVLYLGDRTQETQSDRDQSSLLSTLRKSFVNAQQMLSQPQYCTGQLNSLFTSLLNDYDPDWNQLG